MRFSAALLLLVHVLGKSDEFVGSLGTASKDNVLEQGAERRVYIIILHGGSRIHDAHIQTGTDGMIEEHGVHRLAQVIVSPERERKVADAAADMGARKVRLYPTHRTDEVKPVGVVLLYPGGDGQHVRVEDNILLVEVQPFPQEAVRAVADLYLAFVAVRLPLLIECHDDDGGTHALNPTRPMQELRLALLERDGIYDALALDTHQSLFDNLPLRRIDHNRDASNVGLGSDEVKKGAQLLSRVEQTIVHVYIEQLRAGFDLVPRDLKRFFPATLSDQTEKSSRAGDIASFSYIYEVSFGIYLQDIQPGQKERALRLRGNMRLSVSYKIWKQGDVSGGRSAASTDDIDQPLIDEGLHVSRHLFRRFVVLAKRVGETRVGVGADIKRSNSRKLSEMGLHILGPERAIQTDAHERSMTDGRHESLERLPREGAAALR